MRRSYLVLPILGLVLFVFFLATKSPPKQTSPSAQLLKTSPSPTPEIKDSFIVVTPLVDGDAVELIANYKAKKTSEELQKEYGCEYLVNAGFYTKEETPVGYVKTKEGVLGKAKESLLFDGFITINNLRVPRITRSLPADDLISALQTGPILVENGSEIKLSIKNDKLARRAFALVSGENKILFGIVQSSTLEELPRVISNFAKENDLKPGDAINLDGGSASAFRGPNGVFPEISPIGSAFCIKMPL